jgi:hypothetical protein
MTVSPLDAAQQALGHARRHLFPFRFERWLALGFVAFLDQCGRTQAGFGQFPGGRGVPEEVTERGGPGPVLNEAAAWLAAHVMLVMAIAAVALVVILCLTALVLWINSRGVFMYLDNVSTGRADVSRPWREHAARADSYFAWSFGFTLGTMTGGMVLLITGALAALRMARGQGGIGGGVAALVVLGGLLLILVLAAALASLALRDFVAPIQMRAGVSCGAAIGLFLGLLRLHPGAFVVYVILKIVFALVLAFVVMVAACLTCCCALVPVVTQTLLQPAFYFERAWSLFLLRPMGYDLVPVPAPSPPGVPFPAREEPPHDAEPR